MPVEHRHPGRLGADDEGMRLDLAVHQPAEDLVRLALDLRFLAVDERDHVAEQVQRRHTGVSGPGHGLQRRDHHRAQTELGERAQRQREDGRRAVRVRHDRATPAVGDPLAGQQAEMVRVDLGHDQRHRGVHAIAARVADDDVAGSGELGLQAFGDGSIERREQQLRPATRTRLAHDEVAHGVRARRGQPPGQVAEPAACRSSAGRHPPQSEPRVALEPRDELLPDCASRAEDANVNRSCHVRSPCQKKTRRPAVKPDRRVLAIRCETCSMSPVPSHHRPGSDTCASCASA